jgi:hypothetical protein
MTYSSAHQAFSDILKEPKALTAPEDYLGPNFQAVLDFWLLIDTLSEDEKFNVGKRYLALGEDVRNSPYTPYSSSYYAAIEVVGLKVRDAAWRAAWRVTDCEVFGHVTYELIANIPSKFFYNLIVRTIRPRVKWDDYELTEAAEFLMFANRNNFTTTESLISYIKSVSEKELCRIGDACDIGTGGWTVIFVKSDSEYSEDSYDYIAIVKIDPYTALNFAKKVIKSSQTLKKFKLLVGSNNYKKCLGPNYEEVLKFWGYIDTLSVEECEEIDESYLESYGKMIHSARELACDKAIEVIGDELRSAVCEAAYESDNHRGLIVVSATFELIADVEDKIAYKHIMYHKKF